MKDVLASVDEYAFLHASAADGLVDLRERFRGLAPPDKRTVVEIDDDEARWWTFAGGRINSTLKYAIKAMTDCRVVPENLLVRIRGASIRGPGFDDVLRQLAEPEVWTDAALWTAVRGSLPNYRLSRFQDVLPEPVQGEVIGAFLLDVPRASMVAAAPRVCVRGATA